MMQMFFKIKAYNSCLKKIREIKPGIDDCFLTEIYGVFPHNNYLTIISLTITDPNQLLKMDFELVILIVKRNEWENIE